MNLSPDYFLEIELPNGAIKKLALAKESYLVGRASEADLVIDDPSVSRRHFRLDRREGRYFAIDLGQNLEGIQVNGVRCQELGLRGGDEIRAGSVILRVIVKNSAETSMPLRLPRVPEAEATKPKSRARLWIALGGAAAVILLGVSMVPLQNKRAAAGSQSTSFSDDAWADIEPDCSSEEECRDEANAALELARDRLDRAALSPENLFIATREANRADRAAARAKDQLQAGRAAEISDVRRRAIDELETRTRELRFGFRRALRLHDFELARRYAENMVRMFPDRDARGHRVGQQLLEKVARCRAVKGQSDAC